MRTQPAFKLSHFPAPYIQRNRNNLNTCVARLCKAVSDIKLDLVLEVCFSKVAVRMIYESVTQRWWVRWKIN